MDIRLIVRTSPALIIFASSRTMKNLLKINPSKIKTIKSNAINSNLEESFIYGELCKVN